MRRVRLPGFSTFRARIFWSVMPVVLALLAFHAFMDLRQHRRLVEAEFMKRGAGMAISLGRGTELGVLAENRDLLESAIRGVAGDPDVAYVLVHAEDGRVLAVGGTAANDAASVAARPEALVPAAASGPAARPLTIGGQRGIEFVAPILSEAGGPPDELLLQPLGKPGRSEPRQRTIGFVRLALSLHSVESHVLGLVNLWIGITAVFLAISTLTIYVFSNRITRPIKRLTGLAHKIAEGDLEQTIPVQSRDEIGRLAATFNTMAGALKETIDEKERVLRELQELNQTLEKRIRERTAELEERTVAIEQLSANLQHLYRLSTALQEPLSLRDQLGRVLDAARGVVRIDRFYIWVVTPDGQHLTPLAGAGFSGADSRAFETASIPLAEAGAMARAFREGTALVFNEERPLPPELRLRHPWSTKATLRTNRFVAVPLIARGLTIGVLTADNKHSGEPIDPRTVELLQLFASHAAVAILNARLFQETEEKGHQLELASRHKSQFLANMSHELRTPLNAILGYTELILDRIYGDVPEKIGDVIERVDRSGRHLLGLINDVLDLSKIEAGALSLSLGDYSMQDVVYTVATSMEPLAAEKSLRLTLDVPSDLPVGRGDERRLTQILLNLVGNAIKFTEAGEVGVSVRVEDGWFRVAVSDTGPGVPPEHQERIFGEFQQIDASSTRKKGGTGLGLAIARRILEMHGGRIWVDSAVGAGSTFTFMVPVRVEQEPARS